MLKIEQLEPLEDRVIVEPDPVEELASGISVPDSAQEKPQTGTVIAVGEGTGYKLTEEQKEDLVSKIGQQAFDVLEHMVTIALVKKNGVKVGDRVLFGRYAASEFVIEGKKYLFMRDADVAAILKK